MEVDMKPVFMLLLVLLVAGATPPLGRCPPGCRCDPDPRTVWCSGVEVLPRFHASVEEVWLVGTKLLSVPRKAFADLLNVSHIYISDDDALTHVERHSFHNLSRLTHVQLSAIKRLSFIDPEAFMELPNLKYLGIIDTGITSFPSLTHLHSQQDDFILDIMENTFIHLIPANAFSGISQHSLTVMLNNNGVKEIQRGAFNGSRLEEVYLHGNMDLEKIDELAFDGVIRGPTHLDVSGSRVRSLPTLGLESLEKLRATNVWSLRVLPPPRAFPHLKSAQLTFPSHCCALTTLKSWRGPSEAVICNLSRAALKAHPEAEAAAAEVAPLSQTSRGRRLVRLAPPTDGASSRGSGCPRSAGDGVFYVELPTERPGEEFDFEACGGGSDVASERREPSCSPLPDAFNPCEDVMSGGLLRVLVWVVSLLAVSANLLVLLMLLASRRKLTVTRFLMGHLVFADLCMGAYLLLIASVDMHTRSRYHHYAVAWQTGPGCSLAGALSVFASEMSVFTLTSISLQRWHAIFYAMRPDRKLRLRHAAALMLLGWLLCVLLALLPVLGVSTYQKVSVCLPMDTESRWAWAYVVSLLMIKVVAGVVVCLCYLHIYCMVHNPRHQSSKYDTSMAKRMAVLIFTNFLCLAPICFYGLSAALHQPLITITNSKVLLVLFYPLNSCAHPFFYAILTKAFHRDILMLLSRMGLCQRQAHLYRSQMATINSPRCAHAKSDTRSGLRILKLSTT